MKRSASHSPSLCADFERRGRRSGCFRNSVEFSFGYRLPSRQLTSDWYEGRMESPRHGECSDWTRLRLLSSVEDRRGRYQRPLVHCIIGDRDHGREMVLLGWALAEYGNEYAQNQAEARTAKAGAWASTFTPPKDWRKTQRATLDPTWPLR